MTWLALALGVVVQAAAQEPPPPPLQVVQPGSAAGFRCITALELRRRVELRRGPLSEGTDVPAKRVHVAFVSEGNGVLEVRVVLRDGRGQFIGQRRLRGDAARCRDLDEALVLVVTSLFGLPRSSLAARDGEQARPQEETEPASPLEDGAASAALPSRVAPRRPAQPPRPPWRLKLSLTAGMSTGVTIRPAAGFGAGLWGERARWSFGVEAQGLPRSRAPLAGGGRVRFQAMWVQGLACGAAASGPWARLDLCAGPRLGWLRVTPEGLASNETQLEPVFDVSFGPRLSLGSATGTSRASLSLLVAIPLVVTGFWITETNGTPRTYHENAAGIWLVAGFCWGPPS